MHSQEVVVHVIRYTKTVLKSTMMGLRRSLLTQRDYTVSNAPEQ